MKRKLKSYVSVTLKTPELKKTDECCPASNFSAFLASILYRFDKRLRVFVRLHCNGAIHPLQALV